VYALVANPGSLPGGEVMLWVYLWAFVATMPVATFMLLLFPDGRLPSPRWRPVAWLAAVGMTGVALHSAFAPGRIADFPRDNPLGLGGVAGQIADLLAISFALVTIAALASVIRAEKKDVASAIGLTAVLGVGLVLLLPALIVPLALSH